MLKLQWRRLRSRHPWLQMVKTWRCVLLMIFIVIIILYLYTALRSKPITILEEEIKEIKLGNIEFDFLTGLYFYKDGKDVFLRGSMPDSLQLKGPPTKCGKYNATTQFCAEWYPRVRLEVLHTMEEHASCHSISWTPVYSDYLPQTCFSMADYSWYGGSLLHNQAWPLNKATLNKQPYSTHDLKSYQGKTNIVGNVLDWFWISSAGIAVMLEDEFPIQISVNQSGDNLLCFYSQSNTKVLKYKVCKAANLRKVHRFVTSKMIHLPSSLPSSDCFTKPLWSTDSQFKFNLNQNNLLKYTKDISDKAFSRHSLVIYDESLSVFYVEPFDSKRFPNSGQSLMLARGDYDFKIFLSLTPFIPVSESQYKSKMMTDSENIAFVTNINGQDVNIVNLLDSKVFDWFLEKTHNQLKELFHIDGLRLIGGESEYLSVKGIPEITSNKLSRELIKISEKLSLPFITSFMSETQSSAGGLTVLVSVESSWGTRGGLQSVIPSVLTLGILGYPFVIPNIVGGPGSVTHVNETYSEQVKPDRELYIRWLGVSAYMPCMMFSFPPWLYDDEVVDMAKELVHVHEQVVAPLVIKAAREFEISGSPVVRPLWWLYPTDMVSQTIDDQYMVGDSLLVAPIVHQGHTHRDIYIPQGTWTDNLRNTQVHGQTWLRRYTVELGQVATFSVVKS